ncbi:MAG: DUF6455 family protein [Xanthobacteraceae bacterium]|nr:DUF6455 family protein [Xanthobacteraceae bacterium]
MTDLSKPLAGVNRLIETFGDWLHYRRSIREVREFDSGEFHRIADELGVTPQDLGALVRQGPHAADELPRMLTALGIDADAISRAQPMVYHDMERVCARCAQKGRCDRDLDANTAAQHYEEYCVNAMTIDALTPKAS